MFWIKIIIKFWRRFPEKLIWVFSSGELKSKYWYNRQIMSINTNNDICEDDSRRQNTILEMVLMCFLATICNIFIVFTWYLTKQTKVRTQKRAICNIYSIYLVSNKSAHRDEKKPKHLKKKLIPIRIGILNDITDMCVQDWNSENP